jgi:succinylarginine dihydrolase
MTQQWVETQWDGLVGPTHHYAGLSHGNVASQAHALSVSNPRQAALQGLEKMRLVAQLGIPQFIVPPPVRPNLQFLQQVGFSGTQEDMFADAARVNQRLLSAAWSASYMWRANMATVTPACDSDDGFMHLTPANLISTLHRPQEASESYQFLNAVFREGEVVHEPLPASVPFADEGAANHMRLSGGCGQAGVHVWVYGRAARDDVETLPRRYPARQTREACEALARLHHLPASRCVFVKQTAGAIDAGVFHNDVIAMSNKNVLIYHEDAYDHSDAFIEELSSKLAPVHLKTWKIRNTDLPLAEAVKSYFFNSQLLSLPSGEMVVMAPSECEENPYARCVFDGLIADVSCPITHVYYPALRESMKNGGGPACLRLRIEMDAEMLAAMPSSLRWTPEKHEVLTRFIETTYPEQVDEAMLLDNAFAETVWGIQRRLLQLLS